MKKSSQKNRPIICSACLLGLATRYDGKIKANKKVLDLVKSELLIPVCPEQLGGQSTPRKNAEICGKKVVEADGADVSAEFKKGAREVLKIVKFNGVEKAIFKQRSPSCGCGQVYDGSFSGKIIKGDGITTKLLKKNGIKVTSEEDL